MNDFNKYCKNRIKYGFFRFLFLLLVSIIVFFLTSKLNLFSNKVYALTTETIYSDYNNGSLTNSGKFKYSPSNLGLLFDSATGSLGTKYETASYGLRFWFNEAITTSNTYTIQLNFNDYDVYESVGINYVKVYVYSNDEVNEASLLSVTKSNKSTQYKTLTIKFVSNYTGTIVRVDIQKENTDSTYSRIFGPLNFRLNSVQTESSQAEGTEQIIINNNQNTQNVINNQNENTQNVINNQNENTDKLLDSQKVCSNVDKNNIEIDNKYLDSNGNQQPSTNYGITEYIKIDSETKIKVLTSLNSESAKYCFYTSSKDLISCYTISNSLVDTELTIPNNADYIRSSIQKIQNKPTFQLCKNGNQATTDAINDLNDTLKDTNVDTSSLSNVAGWLPPGPVDSILTLPLTLFNSLLSALNLSCSTLKLPLPFVNSELELPCLGSLLRQISGFWTWYETIGVMVSGIILYNYLLALYKWVDDTLTMRENTMPGYYEDRWGGGA